MMAKFFKGLTDRFGQPIEKSVLETELSAASVGVRSPLTSYPGDGLNPDRLAVILREADAGDPLRYLELAETIEERDPHYAGVLRTRKQSVAQLEISVEPGSDEPAHVKQADMVGGWLKRDELADEIFDMLDAVGKGYSFTEIIWDSSSGQWRPERLEWRDPRWFRFDRTDGRTPTRIHDNGEEKPIDAFKYVFAVMRAKSGLPSRSGLARIIAWAWMFKAFTQRDWAIFTQNYGQPVRLGKYGSNASPQDRQTLYRAVANIGGDMAAIIPESMAIEFIEAKNLGAGHALYIERANWLDQQISKAVLGQTATTDAIAGGHAVGQEHRQVQEDIERADARQLSAIINRDLIRPWIDLEFGPQASYPRVKIGRPETKDVKMLVDAVAMLTPLGLVVGQDQMRALIGIGAPADGDAPLKAAPGDAPLKVAAPYPATNPLPDPGNPAKPVTVASKPAGPAKPVAADLFEAIADGALSGASVLTAWLRESVEAADSLEELQKLVRDGMAGLPPKELEATMRQAMLLAELTGRAEILAQANNG